MINTFDTHTILQNPERERERERRGRGGGRETDRQNRADFWRSQKLQRCGLNRGLDTDVIHSEAPDNAARIPNDTCQPVRLSRHSVLRPFCNITLLSLSLSALLLLQVHARPSNNRRLARGLCSQHLITRVGHTIVLPIKPIYNRNSASALLFSLPRCGRCRQLIG